MTRALTVWLKAHGADIIRDAAGLIGGLLISMGAGEVYRPAGLIMGGLLLVGGAYLSARNRA
jgi:hypothetical protein